MNVHLDTHVALWIAAGDQRKLRPVAAWLRHGTLFLSPIVLVEMELLREIGRVRESASVIFDVLANDYGVTEAAGSLSDLASYARLLGWTRDPFDRLIVAHALANQATLLTADTTILAHCVQACWGKK